MGTLSDLKFEDEKAMVGFLVYVAKDKNPLQDEAKALLKTLRKKFTKTLPDSELKQLWEDVLRDK